MENKKIRNATSLTVDGITFKSKSEASVYKHLLQAGFKPDYEKITYTIWEGFKPTIPFYGKTGLNMKKLISITYTPDFTFFYKGIFIIIEVKGFQNDIFPYKFKMFRKYLEQLNYKNTLIFEVFSIKQLKECIEIIKSYAESRTDEATDSCLTSKG